MNVQFIYINDDLTVEKLNNELVLKTYKPQSYKFIIWKYYCTFQDFGEVFDHICDIKKLEYIYKCLNSKEIELLNRFIFENFI